MQGEWGPSAEAKGLSTDLNWPLSDGDPPTLQGQGEALDQYFPVKVKISP